MISRMKPITSKSPDRLGTEKRPKPNNIRINGVFFIRDRRILHVLDCDEAGDLNIFNENSRFPGLPSEEKISKNVRNNTIPVRKLTETIKFPRTEFVTPSSKYIILL